MPLNIDWQQILLHLLNFVILAGGLYFLLYKPVKAFMAKREAHYAEREADVRKMEADAKAMKAQLEENLIRADEEIQRQRERVHEELTAEKQRQMDEAREQARGIIATASQTAEMRTKKAVEDARDEIRSMAIGMVEKMVLESGGDALDQFLDEAESERTDG